MQKVDFPVLVFWLLVENRQAWLSVTIVWDLLAVCLVLWWWPPYTCIIISLIEEVVILKREYMFLSTHVWDFKVWFLMYNYIFYTCAWFYYLFYAYCIIHLSLFELGNLEYIWWTVGVMTGFLCFSCKKSVVVFTMGAKKEYSVRPRGARFFFFWLRGFRNEDPCKAIYGLNLFLSQKKKSKSFSQ